MKYELTLIIEHETCAFHRTSDIQIHSHYIYTFRSPHLIHICVLLKSITFTLGKIWKDRNDNKLLSRGRNSQFHIIVCTTNLYKSLIIFKIYFLFSYGIRWTRCVRSSWYTGHIIPIDIWNCHVWIWLCG